MRPSTAQLSGAAWLSCWVRRGSVVGCGVAQLGVRRGSVVGCGVAQLVARRLVVRRARVRIPTRHPREVSATELFSDEGMERSLGECSFMDVRMCECIVCMKGKSIKYLKRVASGHQTFNEL